MLRKICVVLYHLCRRTADVRASRAPHHKSVAGLVTQSNARLDIDFKVIDKTMSGGHIDMRMHVMRFRRVKFCFLHVLL